MLDCVFGVWAHLVLHTIGHCSLYIDPWLTLQKIHCVHTHVKWTLKHFYFIASGKINVYPKWIKMFSQYWKISRLCYFHCSFRNTSVVFIVTLTCANGQIILFWRKFGFVCLTHHVIGTGRRRHNGQEKVKREIILSLNKTRVLQSSHSIQTPKFP